MPSQYKHIIFKRIHTIGKLPDGRIIDRTISYPEGTDYDEMFRLEDAMTFAFGSLNCRVVGIPFEGFRRLPTKRN